MEAIRKKPPKLKSKIFAIALAVLGSITFLVPMGTGTAYAEGGAGTIQSESREVENQYNSNGTVYHGKDVRSEKHTDVLTSDTDTAYVQDEKGNVFVQSHKFATTNSEEKQAGGNGANSVGANAGVSGVELKEKNEPDTFTTIRSSVGTTAENVDVNAIGLSDVDFDKVSEEQKESTLKTICTKINGFDEKTCDENREVIAKCGKEKGMMDASRCIGNNVHGNAGVAGVAGSAEESKTAENVGIWGSVLGILNNVKEKIGDVGMGILGVLGFGTVAYASYGYITRAEEKDTRFIYQDEYGSVTGSAQTVKEHHTRVDGSNKDDGFGEEITKFTVSAVDAGNNTDAINGIVSTSEADKDGVRYGRYAYQSTDGSATTGTFKAEKTGNTEFAEETTTKDGRTISSLNSVQYNSEPSQEAILSEIATGRNRTKIIEKATDGES